MVQSTSPTAKRSSRRSTIPSGEGSSRRTRSQREALPEDAIESEEGPPESPEHNKDVQTIQERRREYERLRKRAYRARTCIRLQGEVQAEGIITKQTCELFDGVPLGATHNALIHELSDIVKVEVMCCTPVNDIPNATFQRISSRLISKYENGTSIDFKWVRQNASSLIVYRQTRSR
jgi:hypothetical protein